MGNSPAFEKYDADQFDAWLDAYIASLRKQCQGWWEEERYERLIARVSERGELVRKRLANGDVVLRSMPPVGEMPRYAMGLLNYLDPPSRAPQTEAGKGNGTFSSRPVVPPSPEPEITVLCVQAGFPSIVATRYPAQYSSPSVTALAQSGDSEHTSRSSVGQASQSLPVRRRGARRLAPEKIEREGRRIEGLRNQDRTWREVANEMRLGERTCRERLDRFRELTRGGP